MKKVYKVQNLCCGNCARKIEEKIAALDGVQECRLNFMTLRLTIVSDDGKEEDVLQQAKKIAKKIEPECEIV
ncbi:MAG: cation transporter [Christensenellales bacterium]